MLTDIVVDTNIWLHAQNPNEERFQASVDFLDRLISSDVQLCIDRVFDIMGSSNTSFVGSEYLANIRPTGFAYQVLQQLLASSRVKSVPDKVSEHERKVIERLVPKNKTDRRFLRVACNSSDRYLVSHDFYDFKLSVRGAVARELRVTILEAAEILAEMSAED